MPNFLNNKKVKTNLIFIFGCEAFIDKMLRLFRLNNCQSFVMVNPDTCHGVRKLGRQDGQQQLPVKQNNKQDRLRIVLRLLQSYSRYYGYYGNK